MPLAAMQATAGKIINDIFRLPHAYFFMSYDTLPGPWLAFYAAFHAAANFAIMRPPVYQCTAPANLLLPVLRRTAAVPRYHTWLPACLLRTSHLDSRGR